jgi:hypothetical protein
MYLQTVFYTALVGKFMIDFRDHIPHFQLQSFDNFRPQFEIKQLLYSCFRLLLVN